MCVRCFSKLFGMGRRISEDDILQTEYSKSKPNKLAAEELRNGQSPNYGGLSKTGHSMELTSRSRQLKKGVQGNSLGQKTSILVSLCFQYH